MFAYKHWLWSRDFIAELVGIICKIISLKAKWHGILISFDGSPRKLMDCSISSLGWKPSIDLKEGLNETYLWYKNQKIDGKMKDVNRENN